MSFIESQMRKKLDEQFNLGLFAVGDFEAPSKRVQVAETVNRSACAFCCNGLMEGNHSAPAKKELRRHVMRVIRTKFGGVTALMMLFEILRWVSFIWDTFRAIEESGKR